MAARLRLLSSAVNARLLSSITVISRLLSSKVNARLTWLMCYLLVYLRPLLLNEPFVVTVETSVRITIELLLLAMQVAFPWKCLSWIPNMYIYSHVYGAIPVTNIWDLVWMFGFIDTLFTQLDTTGSYSATAHLHTLHFTVTHPLCSPVFTSRIVVKYLEQSHCNFKSRMKSSCHSLVHFLPFLLNHLGLPSSGLDQVLDNSLKWTLLQLHSLNFWQKLTVPFEFLVI
jgi:hypothetical protein